jgi:hypothetical protein
MLVNVTFLILSDLLWLPKSESWKWFIISMAIICNASIFWLFSFVIMGWATIVHNSTTNNRAGGFPWMQRVVIAVNIFILAVLIADFTIDPKQWNAGNIRMLLPFVMPSCLIPLSRLSL